MSKYIFNLLKSFSILSRFLERNYNALLPKRRFKRQDQAQSLKLKIMNSINHIVLLLSKNHIFIMSSYSVNVHFLHAHFLISGNKIPNG